MDEKKIFYGQDARDRLLKGAETLYQAVKTTMGPRGHNVVITNKGGHPSVSHDGVTVANSVNIPDNEETLGQKAGADLIKQAAGRLNDSAGDGTTTVTVLTYHILNEANKLLAAGNNAMPLRLEIEAAAKEALAELSKMTEDIKDKQRMAQIGTISAGDKELGDLVAGVFSKIGKDGVVSVESSQGLETTSEVVKGFQLNRGFISPYFINDLNRLQAVTDEPAVIVTTDKLSVFEDIAPLMDKLLVKGKKDIVVFASDVDGEALKGLIRNKMQGNIRAIVVKAPGYGDEQKEILKDISVITGAEIISAETGLTFELAETDHVGSAHRIISDDNQTTIVQGAGKPKAVSERISQVKDDKRKAALAGKVAVIRVGGDTEIEIEERKYRVDDAVAAVKAAIAEGIVPGGGSTLLALANSIKTDTNGAKILAAALEQPFTILMENAGIKPEVWIDQIKKKTGWGLDVNNPSRLIALKKHGIIDPVRVTREAISSSVSIAATAITMGALVVDIPKEDK